MIAQQRALQKKGSQLWNLLSHCMHTPLQSKMEHPWNLVMVTHQLMNNLKEDNSGNDFTGKQHG